MKKTYCRSLQLISIFLILLIAFSLFELFPAGIDLVFKDNDNGKLIWNIIAWVELLPILYCGLMFICIYENIYKDKIFTSKNLGYLKVIRLAVVLNIFIVLLCNISAMVLSLQTMHLMIINITFLLMLTMVYAALSLVCMLMNDAVNLQDDSDLTI